MRTDARLAVAEARLSLMGAEIEHDFRRLRVTPDLVELRNIALVAQLIVRSARLRRESRGLHYNLDHPRPVRRFAGHSTILRRRKHR